MILISRRLHNKRLIAKPGPKTIAKLFVFLFLSCLVGANLFAYPSAGVSQQEQVEQNALAPTIPILAYHDISPAPVDDYQVSPELFASQMDVLQAYGYQTIGISDLMAFLDIGSPLPEKPIIITFDDGLQGIYQYAYPILKTRSMTATSFIITGKIGENEAERQDNFSWNPGGPFAYHMIWPEIQAMSADGFEFGSHSDNHATLDGAYPNTAQNELEISRQKLQDHLPGKAINYFAYPHGVGANDPIIRALVEQAGYSAAFTYPGSGAPIDPMNIDLLSIPRISIFRTTGMGLNLDNPWNFFMRRVNPNFPLPNIGIYSKAFYDSWGTYRRTFYPGEPITMVMQISNWNSATYVRGSMKLFDASQKIFDSSLTNPSQETTITPLQKANPGGVFTYTLTAPEVSVKTLISYTLTVYDSTGLLTFYTMPITTSKMYFEPSPINIDASALDTLDFSAPKPITFTISSAAINAEETFLTVNLSPGLGIDSTGPAGAWKIYPIGSTVKRRGCAAACMQTYLLMGEVKVPVFGAGQRQYTLWIHRMPGAINTEWITYRMAMHIPGAPIPFWYLRDPMFGIYDQQDYFAKKVNIPNPLQYWNFIPKL